ncbi:MAG: GtrA family protein [Hyphomicrobiaceae bacterium]
MVDGSPVKPRDAASGVPRARHWGGFLASGAIAFTVDGSVMEIGVRLLGLPTLLARLAGVMCAMVAAWLSHRTLTFALTKRPDLAEFSRYVAAASTTALINYGVFVVLLITWPAMPRLIALVIASCVATIFAYLSMRYGVFRRY